MSAIDIALWDLKGKAIGVTSVGATTWVFARMFARAQGWDPDKDVKVVALGGLDAQIAALSRKEIAAYVWGDGGAVMQLAGRKRVEISLLGHAVNPTGGRCAAVPQHVVRWRAGGASVMVILGDT